MAGYELLAHRNAVLTHRDKVAVGHEQYAPSAWRKMAANLRLTNGRDFLRIDVNDLPSVWRMQLHQRDAAGKENGDTREETPKPQYPHLPSPGRQGFWPANRQKQRH